MLHRKMEFSPVSEAARLKILSSYEVLDQAQGPALERLTRLAADLFDAAIVRFAFDAADPFCAQALAMAPGAVLVVEDVTEDDRFQGSPLVAGEARIRFYAGAVLTNPDGLNLGALCVLDDRVRPPLTAAETERLSILAGMAVDALELRRVTRRNAETERGLELVERLAVAGRKAETAWPAGVNRLRRAL